MPFKSESQRRFMWSQHPKIARRWSNEMATTKNLPPWLQKAKGGKNIDKAKTPNGFVDAIKRRKAKMAAASGKSTEKSDDE